jgi:ABC-2 type transport system permease protein
MTTVACTVSDSATMLRRSLRRLVRYPSMTVLLVGMPIVFLLLFVYVFGGELGHGLGRGLGGGFSGRAEYLNYVTPGILLVTVAIAVQGTAIVVAMDMTGGIIDRFRTMAVARSAVLTGHVLASMIQTLASLGIVVCVAVALSFRPTDNPGAWVATIGILALFTLALIWLATALGLAAKSVETASTHVPDVVTFPGQRLRSHRDHAGGTAPVRGIPTLHTRDRDRTRASHGDPDRGQCPCCGSLERWRRARLLLLGGAPLPKSTAKLTRRNALAPWG